jgi:hypothetical protein
MLAFVLRVRQVSAALVVTTGLLAAACSGDSPTGPSVTNIAGTWSDTMTQGRQFGPITLSLVQVAPGVSGTWVLTDSSGFVDASGTVDGEAVSGQFAGTMTLNGCDNTVATLSGPAGGATPTWTSPGFVGPGGQECPKTTPGFSITVQRQ